MKGLPPTFSRRFRLSALEINYIKNKFLKSDDCPKGSIAQTGCDDDKECGDNSYKVIESYDIVRDLEKRGALVVNKIVY